MDLLDRLAYRFQTRDYFEPFNECQVTQSDLQKIFEGNVRNPYKLKNPRSTTEYPYFVVCTKGLDLQEESAESFTPEMIDLLFNRSEWFGHFNTRSSSSIIIPFTKKIQFSPREKVAYASQENDSAWVGGGTYQVDKNIGSRVLTCDISLDEMLSLMNLRYRFFEVS